MESQIGPGHQREKERNWTLLLVVWDETNKEQDNPVVTLGRKRLHVRVIRVNCFIV